MNIDFTVLFNYVFHADRMVADLLIRENQGLEEPEALFSHILNTQRIWANRIMGLPDGLERMQVQLPADFYAISQENERLYTVIVQEQTAERSITYRQSTGGVFQSEVKDILFHVVNHSTYHRAQVVSQLKRAGITPPTTDYIVLKREGLL